MHGAMLSPILSIVGVIMSNQHGHSHENADQQDSSVTGNASTEGRRLSNEGLSRRSAFKRFGVA